MSNYDNTNSGVLFKNDKKGNEKAPDYKGKVNIEGKEKDIAGWIREGKSGKFISIKVFNTIFKEARNWMHNLYNWCFRIVYTHFNLFYSIIKYKPNNTIIITSNYAMTIAFSSVSALMPFT